MLVSSFGRTTRQNVCKTRLTSRAFPPDAKLPNLRVFGRVCVGECGFSPCMYANIANGFVGFSGASAEKDPFGRFLDLVSGWEGGGGFNVRVG